MRLTQEFKPYIFGYLFDSLTHIQGEEVEEMEEEKRDRAIWADEDTHTEIAVMAARKKITIKKILKEIVDFYRANIGKEEEK